jgi:hypothetical protein
MLQSLGLVELGAVVLAQDARYGATSNNAAIMRNSAEIVRPLRGEQRREP